MRWDYHAFLALGALALGVLAAPMVATAAGLESSPASVAPHPEPRKRVGDSVLFSRQAQDLIEAARGGMVAVSRNGQPSSPAATEPRQAMDILHLSAIVYHDPTDWRVWLNGRRFTPNSRAGTIELVDVGPDAVWLLWHGLDQPATPVQLRPNQSYVIASGMIVEGRVGPTLTQLQGRTPAITN